MRHDGNLLETLPPPTVANTLERGFGCRNTGTHASGVRASEKALY